MKRLTRQEKEAMRKLASSGGKAAAKKRTKKEWREWSKQANAARWAKKKAGKQ